MNKSRKIYFVMAGGGHETDRHYYETIKTKRTIDELSRFLEFGQIEQLKRYSNGRPYAVWGAVPGPRNIPNWESMESGDYVMVYRSGKIILAAEVAMKVRNSPLAEYLWQKDEAGKTWEYIYFMINEVPVQVEIEKLNKYLGYQDNYHPQGFMAIDQNKADTLLSTYGDLVSLLQKLERGEKLAEVEPKEKLFNQIVDDQIERAPTEHSEMQWRLIRLGNLSKLDVWVPPGDQGRHWENNIFRDHVLSEFREGLDTPKYIENIDTVWKLGLSIKAAFEIENSTSIYSGILRLSDLRALAPNSNYPLFIVADKAKRNKVFDQLRRPTFSNDYLGLDRIVHYLSYDKLRELDSQITQTPTAMDLSWLTAQAELCSQE